MKPAKIAVALLLGLLLVSGLACAGGGTGSEPTPTPTTTATVDENTGKFEIYLAINSSAYDFSNFSDVEDVALQEEPIVSPDDIISYNWSSHCIELTEEGCRHVLTALGGYYFYVYPFVVVANNERIYIGSFVSMISSYWPDCPTIWYIGCSPCIWKAPHDSDESDIRSDIRIHEALKQAGKLIE